MFRALVFICLLTGVVASPGTTCVSQSVLKCINDYSSYWPKCDPSQAKTNAGPSGYEFGYYCTQEWTNALNSMLSTVGKCGDVVAIKKLLGETTYETGYFSTVYQPRDGGAGLIHMIPGNWPINAKDMDTLFGNKGYASKAASMGKSFFQSAQYGWLSVAAWYKSTNRVIGNCGLDLFDQSYDTQTRCILGSPNDRSETYNVASSCFDKFMLDTTTRVATVTVTNAAPTTTVMGTTTVSATTTTQPPTVTTSTTAMQSLSTTTSKIGGNGSACSGTPCSDVRLCRSKWGFCGSSQQYCNAESTWKAFGCRKAESGSCSGAPCSGTGLCRSKWGHCGASPQHCNDESTWKVSGCTQIRFGVLSFNGTNVSAESNDVGSLSKASRNLGNADIAMIIFVFVCYLMTK